MKQKNQIYVTDRFLNMYLPEQKNDCEINVQLFALLGTESYAPTN